MKAQDLYDLPELARFRDELGNQFEPQVSRALGVFQQNPDGKPAESQADISVLIAFVVNFLQAVIQKKMDEPATTKPGKIIRLIWGFANAFGLLGKAKQKILEETKKL